MAFESIGHQIAGVDSSADYTAEANAGRFVTVGASGVALVGTAGALAHAVMRNNPDSDKAADIVREGIVKMNCGGTISAGDDISSNATGQAIAATTGHNILGIAIDAGSSGGYCSVLLVLPGLGTAS